MNRKITAFFMYAVSSLLLFDVADAGAQSNVRCKGCVDSRDIKNNSVRSIDILNNTVRGKDIRKGTITPANLAPAATPAGADSGYSASVTFTNVLPVLVTSVSLDLTNPGLVVLNASGYVKFIESNTSVFCWIGEDTAQTSNLIALSAETVMVAARSTVAITDVFEVNEAGTKTFGYYCTLSNGSANAASLFAAKLTAIYVPSRL